MNKRLLFLFLVIIVVAALGAAGYFFFSPTRVVEKAVDQLGAAETANFNLALELENAAATKQVLNGEQGTIEVVMDGAFVRRENQPDDLQAKTKFLTKTDSVSVNVEGELRFIENSVYGFIEKTPPLFAALNQLKGKWLEFPRGGTSETVAQTVPETLFTEVKRVGSETLNGEKVVVYQAVAREEAVINMMDGIAEVLGTRLTSEQIDNLRTSVAQVKQVPVEIKVRQFSNSLRQLGAVLTVTEGNTIRFTLTIKDTNQPVTITKPEGAVQLQQAAQELQNAN